MQLHVRSHTNGFIFKSTLQFPPPVVRPVLLQQRRPFRCLFLANKSHFCLAKVFIIFNTIPTSANYRVRTFLLFIPAFSVFGFDSLCCAMAVQPIRLAASTCSATKSILCFVTINPALLNDRSLQAELHCANKRLRAILATLGNNRSCCFHHLRHLVSPMSLLSCHSYFL